MTDNCAVRNAEDHVLPACSTRVFQWMCHRKCEQVIKDNSKKTNFGDYCSVNINIEFVPRKRVPAISDTFNNVA